LCNTVFLNVTKYLHSQKTTKFTYILYVAQDTTPYSKEKFLVHIARNSQEVHSARNSFKTNPLITAVRIILLKVEEYKSYSNSNYIIR
jgi:hypothetical protein